MVEVEAAQEVLVGFALAAVLRDDEAGHRFQDVAGPIGRFGLQLLGDHKPLAGRLGCTDVARARVEQIDRGKTGATDR